MGCPVSNLVQMLIWAAVAKVLLLTFENTSSEAVEFWFKVAGAGIQVNVVFAVLNLLPVPPLDGGRIVTALLPGNVSYRFAQIERYGLFIVLAIMLIPAVNRAIFLPPIAALTNFTIAIFGLA